MSLARSEPEYETIARICKGEEPIPRLMKMLEDPATVTHDRVQEAILYLMEAKHQWREIVQAGLRWNRSNWLGAFIGRMRNRVNENEKHYIAIDKYQGELERLISKFQREDQRKRQVRIDQQRYQERRNQPDSIHRPSRKVHIDLSPVQLGRFSPLKSSDNSQKIAKAKMDQAIRSKAFQMTGEVSYQSVSLPPTHQPGKDVQFSFQKNHKALKAPKESNVNPESLFDFFDLEDLEKENQKLLREEEEEVRKLQMNKKQNKPGAQAVKAESEVAPPATIPQHPSLEAFGHTPNTARRRKRKSRKVEEYDDDDDKPNGYPEMFNKKMAERGLQYNQKGEIVDYRRQNKILNFTKQEIDQFISGGDKADEKILKKIQADIGVPKILDNLMKTLNAAVNQPPSRSRQARNTQDDQLMRPSLSKLGKVVKIKNGHRVVDTFEYYDSSFLESSESEASEDEVQSVQHVKTENNVPRVGNVAQKPKDLEIQGVSQRHDARFQNNARK